jgi:excisionase family DNA binding protein
MERLLTYKEAAEIIGVSVRTLQKLVGSGDIACVRLGRKVRFTERFLIDYINRCVEEAR